MSGLFDGLFGEGGAAVGAADAIGIGSSGMPWGSLISGGLSLLGGERTNEANRQQASDQMAFQERMSSSAYQRAVKDMQAAGLNPMLAYSQGGASTPGGAMGVMQNALGNATQSAQQGYSLGAINDKLKADTDVSRTQALLNNAQALKVAADTRLSTSSASQVDETIKRLVRENQLDIGGHNVNLVSGQGKKASMDYVTARERFEQGGVEADLANLRAQTKATLAEAVLRELEQPGARNRAASEDTWWGRNIRPYLTDAVRSTSSAGALGRGLRP